MLVDWFTVVAQVVNFLVLVLLLKVFLYDRVVAAMDERERKIAAQLEDAQEAEEKARAEAEEYQASRKEIEDAREARMHEAREAAEKKRRELVEEARAEFERLRERWRGTLERERERFSEELRTRAAEQVLALARRVLADLADARLEHRMVGKLVRQLEAANGERLDELREAAKREPLTVRTAFDVPPEERERLREVVRSRLAADAECRFETDASMTCGVELRAGGRAIGWDLDSYLDELVEATGALLREEGEERQEEQGRG